MGEYEYRLRDMDGYCEEPDGWDWWKLILLAAALLMVVGMLTGCRTKYVSVPERHTEYIVRTDTIAKTDSVLVKDSVYVYHNGDTVVVNKVLYRDRLRNVYKVRTDTIVRRDSVGVPYPVEKELTKWERRYISIGRYTARAAACVAVVAVLSLLVWLAKRLRKK